MITLQCKLKFKTPQDKQAVLNLMRNFSACTRYAYNRLLFPLLGKLFVRDFSPLRGLLVSGVWERRALGLVPAPGAGAMDGRKPPGGAGHPEGAANKYPTQNCTNVQFC